ncbi:MAG: hypothetical protein U0R17_05365 [Acidimicrobiia bacterium]
MTTTPNPTLQLTTIDGITRSLDDWTTVFTNLWVVLPPKLEANEIIPVAEQIFKTFGDSDARCAYLIPASEQVAKKVLSQTSTKAQCFIDEDAKVCGALGVTQTPSLVYIRQDTAVTHIAQGFNLENWIKTCDEIAKTLRWTSPQLSKFSNVDEMSFSI